jgi:hypothetical protein
MNYDSLYPIFCAARQGRNGMGSRLRQGPVAAMPGLRARFDHRPWTPPQAGPRSVSRLDGIRRGRRPDCGKTFTFLPWLSLPYTHYSLLARSQALRRRFVEHRSWEEAMPSLKSPDRVPDRSTLRAGLVGWTPPSRPFPFCAELSPASLTGWGAAPRSIHR